MDTIEQLLKNLKEEAVVRSDFRTNARIRVINTVSRPHPFPRYLGYTVGTAIATAALSVTTVFAAQTSLPGNPLYPVKVFSEDVALTLSPTKSMKTSVAQTIISRRVTEVEAEKKQGDAPAIQKSIDHLNRDVQDIRERKDVEQDKIDTVVPTPEPEIKKPEVKGDETKNEDHKNEQDTRRGDD